MSDNDPDPSESLVLDDATTQRLTAQFRLELDKLEELQAERREEAARRAVEMAAKAEAAARGADEKLGRLLTIQVDQDQAKAGGRKLLRWVLGVALGAGVPGAGYGGYRYATAPEKLEPGEVVERTINDRMADAEERQAAYGARIKRLGDLHYKQMELILDSNDEVTERLDKILARLRVELDEKEKVEPETIQEAREAVDAYKRLKEAEHREDILKSGDPFADLPEPAPFVRPSADQSGE